MQPVKTKKKLSRADKKQIEAAIARANRTDKKGKSAQDSIPYERMWPDGICRVSDGAVKVVEKIAPAFKDSGLILVLGELIVDVLKLDGLGLMGICDSADAVRPHPLIGDAVLGGLLLPVRPVRPGNRRFDLFAVAPGQLFLPHRLGNVLIPAAPAFFVFR